MVDQRRGLCFVRKVCRTSDERLSPAKLLSYEVSPDFSPLLGRRQPTV